MSRLPLDQIHCPNCGLQDVRLSDGWTALDHFALRVGLTALRCRWCEARFYRFVALPEPVKRRLGGVSMFQVAMRVLSGRPLPGARKSMPLLAAPPSGEIRYVARTMPTMPQYPRPQPGPPTAPRPAAARPSTAQRPAPPKSQPQPYTTILRPQSAAPLRQAYQASANRRLLSEPRRRTPAAPGSKRLFCVLLLDDDPSMRRLFNRLLSKEGYMVEEASDISAASAELRAMLPDLMVVNLSKRHDEDAAVKTFRKAHPDLTMVVLSENVPFDNGDRPDLPRRLLYLSRPCRVSDLILRIDDVAAQAPPPKPVVLTAVYTT
jgi:CheY-like chemotaxis protein